MLLISAKRSCRLPINLKALVHSSQYHKHLLQLFIAHDAASDMVDVLKQALDACDEPAATEDDSSAVGASES